MNLQQFKSEYRMMCNDTWGCAMEAWFECAGWLYSMDVSLPLEWEYSAGICGDGREPDCYWYDIFSTLDRDQLMDIGTFLFRYCQYLQFKGVNY